MTCAVCNTKIKATDTQVTRFIPSENRPPHNSKIVETDYYTTEATIESRHVSCHIRERVSARNFRGM